MNPFLTFALADTSLYGLLLLDDDILRFAAFLFKAIPTAILYGLALYFLLNKWRTSESKPIGVMLACFVAYIGFRCWPEPDIYGAPSASDYFLVFFLCIPLLTAVFIYLLVGKSAEK